MLCLILLMVIITGIAGEEIVWPSILSVPVFDSTQLLRSGGTLRQSVGQHRYHLENGMALLRRDSTGYLEQQLYYDFSHDHYLRVQNHQLDLSGFYLRRGLLPKNLSLGVEWSPVVTLNRDYRSGATATQTANNGTGIALLRCGPLVDIRYLDLPVRFSAGSSVDLWQENLPRDLIDTKKNHFRADAGFYGKLTVGEFTTPLVGGIPLYASGRIIGNYMNHSKITHGNVNGLFHTTMGVADTLFVYCADTLSKGRTAFFQRMAGGASQYISTTNRSDNSFHALVGIQDIGTYLLLPSLVYSYSVKTTDFPRNSRILGDVRDQEHALYTTFISEDGTILDYRGALAVRYSTEDWLYGSLIGTNVVSKDSSSNRDTLRVNSMDYTLFSAATTHDVSGSFDNGLSIRYSLSLENKRKRFPNVYISMDNPLPDTSVREDNDYAVHRHYLETIFFSPEWLQYLVSGEYTQNMGVFLRKERSRDNKKLKLYEINFTMLGKPRPEVMFTQTFGMMAKYAEFYFPEFHTDDNFAVSRRFYSKFNTQYGLTPRLSLDGYVNVIYRDDGFWSDPAVDSLVTESADNFYAIEAKYLETSVNAGVRFFFSSVFSVRLGHSIMNNYDWIWDAQTKKYEQSQYRNYILTMKPVIEMDATVAKRFSLKGALHCYLDGKIRRRSGGSNALSVNHWEGSTMIQFAF